MDKGNGTDTKDDATKKKYCLMGGSTLGFKGAIKHSQVQNTDDKHPRYGRSKARLKSEEPYIEDL